jgi:signal transduction histidine kinase
VDGTSREVVIEVEDNGRGVPEEDLSRIFSPFFGTNPGGAGLGLPAVRRIARAHGGQVEVTSILGRGSTFTIRLPRESGRQ